MPEVPFPFLFYAFCTDLESENHSKRSAEPVKLGACKAGPIYTEEMEGKVETRTAHVVLVARRVEPAPEAGVDECARHKPSV